MDSRAPLNALAANVAAAMSTAGMTPAMLTAATDIGESRVASALAGEDLTYAELIAISDATHVLPEHLVEGVYA